MQNEKVMDQLKSRNKSSIEQRDDDIQRLNEETTQRSLLNEKLTKENKSLKFEVPYLDNYLVESFRE